MSVRDIRCPNCGLVDPVHKEAIGTYRCEECGHEFEHTDIAPDG